MLVAHFGPAKSTTQETVLQVAALAGQGGLPTRKENGMANALSREEWPRMASKDLKTPDASLASGDVGAPIPT